MQDFLFHESISFRNTTNLDQNVQKIGNPMLLLEICISVRLKPQWSSILQGVQLNPWRYSTLLHLCWALQLTYLLLGSTLGPPPCPNHIAPWIQERTRIYNFLGVVINGKTTVPAFKQEAQVHVIIEVPRSLLGRWISPWENKFQTTSKITWCPKGKSKWYLI